jgi:negative regulator of genetic competence, sporulation and motility
LVIVEAEENAEKKAQEIRQKLAEEGFVVANNYLEAMDALERGDEKILYVETREKLDNLIFEIITEYSTGIISLADRVHNTGLKTVKFNPFEHTVAIILTREQIEKSNPRLFEYFGIKESLQ